MLSRLSQSFRWPRTVSRARVCAVTSFPLSSWPFLSVLRLFFPLESTQTANELTLPGFISPGRFCSLWRLARPRALGRVASVRGASLRARDSDYPGACSANYDIVNCPPPTLSPVCSASARSRGVLFYPVTEAQRARARSICQRRCGDLILSASERCRLPLGWFRVLRCLY